MRISRREFGCLLPAAIAGWPLIAAAQAPNVVETIANYSGTDRQALLEAGARRERGAPSGHGRENNGGPTAACPANEHHAITPLPINQCAGPPISRP